jgi:hypothetical protein
MCIFLLFVIPFAAVGCGREQGEEATSEVAPVGKTATYDWYMEGSTPAGKTTIVRTGDGRITNESFVHWNNREWTVNSELQLDENGLITSQKITGISPFQAPIDEKFSYIDGVASWSTPGESGSVTTDDPAFYLPNEKATVGAMGALVRAAAKSLDNEIALFPSGSAKVEKVKDVSVASPDGERTLTYMHCLESVSRQPTVGLTRIWK